MFYQRNLKMENRHMMRYVLFITKKMQTKNSKILPPSYFVYYFFLKENVFSFSWSLNYVNYIKLTNNNNILKITDG